MTEQEFWAARPILTFIREESLARMAPPWGVLGVTIAKTIANTPPTVVITGGIGAPASLNSIITLVSPSSGGKGISISTAEHIFQWDNDTNVYSIGTGEGIVATYAKPNPKPSDDNPAPILWERTQAIFNINEIDTLTAQSARQGATIMPTIRSAWSGELLGSTIADRTRRCLLPPHSYRAVFIIGAQPTRSATYLQGKEADGGTPQRFLWLPSYDLAITETQTDPDNRPLMQLHSPEWSRFIDDNPQDKHGNTIMSVCAQAKKDMKTERVKAQRGLIHPLDGHKMLVRLKTAAALALMEARTKVNDEDWALSGVIINKSTETRQHCLDSMVLQRKQKAEEDAQITDEYVRYKAKIARQRVEKIILAKLKSRGGSMTRSELNRAIAGRDKKSGAYEEAIYRLHRVARITTDETEKGEVFTLLDDIEI
ncbi:MAG: hypothetical protein FWG15_02870 [Propionibacteriaceae bacterium]|nr:hypothetical protein [Propionibacteriaceae bacterium]